MLFVVKLVILMVINTPKKHDYYIFTTIKPWLIFVANSVVLLVNNISPFKMCVQYFIYLFTD